MFSRLHPKIVGTLSAQLKTLFLACVKLDVKVGTASPQCRIVRDVLNNKDVLWYHSQVLKGSCEIYIKNIDKTDG